MLRLRKSSMNWDKSRRIFKFQFLVHARSLVTWIRMQICFNPELPRFVQMIDQSSNKSTVFGRGGQIIVYSGEENDYDNETWCMITKHFLGCTCVSLSAMCWTRWTKFELKSKAKLNLIVFVSLPFSFISASLSKYKTQTLSSCWLCTKWIWHFEQYGEFCWHFWLFKFKERCFILIVWMVLLVSRRKCNREVYSIGGLDSCGLLPLVKFE